MTVQLIDTETFQCKKFEGHEAPILNVALDPKLEYILSSSCDGSVKLWKIETASCVKVSFFIYLYLSRCLFCFQLRRKISKYEDNFFQLWQSQKMNQGNDFAGNGSRGSFFCDQDNWKKFSETWKFIYETV